jgi:hypothetical protein
VTKVMPRIAAPNNFPQGERYETRRRRTRVGSQSIELDLVAARIANLQSIDFLPIFWPANDTFGPQRQPNRRNGNQSLCRQTAFGLTDPISPQKKDELTARPTSIFPSCPKTDCPFN